MDTQKTTTAPTANAGDLKLGQRVAFGHHPSLRGRRFQITSRQTSALRPGQVQLSANDVDATAATGRGKKRRPVVVTFTVPADTTVWILP